MEPNLQAVERSFTAKAGELKGEPPIIFTESMGVVSWSFAPGAMLRPDAAKLAEAAKVVVDGDPFAGDVSVPLPSLQASPQAHLEAVERVLPGEPLTVAEVDGRRALILGKRPASQDDYDAIKAAVQALKDPLPASPFEVRQRILFLASQAAPMLAARQLGSALFDAEISDLADQISALEASIGR